VSSHDTLVTAGHFDYIAARTQKEDAFLRRMKAAARKAGIPPIWIGPVQESFMQILLQLIGARVAIEVGCLAGTTAIVLARALGPRGRVTTIEINDRFADFAEAWIAKSDVAGRVTVLRGDARRVLPSLRRADAMFLDADKGGYPAYLAHARRILRPGGMILVDNAFAFGELLSKRPKDRETPAVLRFNEIMAREKGFRSVIVPVGDGLWVGVRSAR
jgi:caffeoyl-CoA O-methyltransferase